MVDDFKFCPEKGAKLLAIMGNGMRLRVLRLIAERVERELACRRHRTQPIGTLSTP
jgi:DNA-binding transcriptional ArsR family regulator